LLYKFFVIWLFDGIFDHDSDFYDSDDAWGIIDIDETGYYFFIYLMGFFGYYCLIIFGWTTILGFTSSKVLVICLFIWSSTFLKTEYCFNLFVICIHWSFI